MKTLSNAGALQTVENRQPSGAEHDPERGAERDTRQLRGGRRLRMGRLSRSGQQKAPPFDRGILIRVIEVEQRPILDEEKRGNEHRRDAAEPIIDAFRIARMVERSAVAILEQQSRLWLFVIERIAVAFGEILQRRR